MDDQERGAIGVRRMGTKWYAELRFGRRCLRSDGPHGSREGAQEAASGLERYLVNQQWVRALTDGRVKP